ncbi:hypothetical protein GDO78_007559 [Eleutherodactylus coqui]|uniref:Uncharacterized protein n=1 Tax=Eleutherodactylus coqui TaxID=57060 RepID=A0A8J6FJL3_ELECQ|nr:hypothetical protein GDO78_007559 [Eleutherodactylus coqui]
MFILMVGTWLSDLTDYAFLGQINTLPIAILNVYFILPGARRSVNPHRHLLIYAAHNDNIHQDQALVSECGEICNTNSNMSCPT